jgi:hypothetical protein
MKSIKAIGAILVFVLFAAACGGDDDGGTSANDQPLIDAIAAQMDEDPPPDDVAFDSNCMATAVVSTLGGADSVEEKYGVTAADVAAGTEIEELNLDRDSAVNLVEGMWDCADFADLMLSSLAEDMSNDQAKCMLDAIGEDTIQLMMASTFMGDGADAVGEEAEEALFDRAIPAIVDCDLDIS